MSYCEKCGARLADGAKFCPGCGTKCDPPKQPPAASPRKHWLSPTPSLEDTPAQEQSASRPQETPAQEQPASRPQEKIPKQKTEYASQEFEVISPQQPLYSYQAPQATPPKQPPFTSQPPQVTPPQQPSFAPPRQQPQKNKSRKPLLIVLFSLIGVGLALGAVLVILLLGKSSAKANTFDLSCSQYSAEMNRIMGTDKLKEDKWKITEANAVYVDESFKIDLDLDKDSQKIKSIKVSPTDSEEAAKMAAVSIMTVDPDADQGSSLRELAEVKEDSEKEIVKEKIIFYIDETEKTYVIKPKPDEKKSQDTTASATKTTGTSHGETVISDAATDPGETAVPSETTEPETEPVTEISYSYREEYAKVLEQVASEHSSETRFQLVYINDDDIPELGVITGGSHLSQIALYTFYDGKAVFLDDLGAYGMLPYSERNNRIFAYTGINENPELEAKYTYMIEDDHLVQAPDYQGYETVNIHRDNSYENTGDNRQALRDGEFE